jgi:eukaryotic-like serine/threonine-protein kinase
MPANLPTAQGVRPLRPGAVMLKPDEVKFLAVLVQRGHLDKGAAEQLFGELSASKLPKTLDQALLERGHFAADKLAFLKATGGEDVPIVPGFAYIARAGFGGTAVVFKGIEKATQRKVALKVMHRPLHADALQKRRFVREAKLLMRLDHPNIVRGVRVGHVKESDGSERLVFVLEWIDGRSLLELLREGTQFDEDTALFIILQAARALQYMHGQGVLHRDVKPDNILLTAEQQVKLIDLGFATELNQAEEGVGGDTTVGTAAYMSPEQARGISDLDVRSDIYSLGATLYQIVVGQLPFEGEGTQEQLAARILAELSSPELQSRRISPHMNYFIRKMMEQDRDFRYGDMGELISDIETQISGKKSMVFGSGDDELLDGDMLEPLGDEPPPGPQKPPPFGKIPPRRRR